jgi:hypothetical protein
VSATFEKRAAHDHSTGKIHNQRSWLDRAGKPEVIHHSVRIPRFLKNVLRAGGSAELKR